MELNCICTLYKFFVTPSNWKDYIIPFISPIIGVGGAYWIMFKQIKNNKDIDKVKELEDNIIIWNAFISNTLTINGSAIKLKDRWKEIMEELDDVDYDFYHTNSFISGLEVVKNLDYKSIYKSFRPTFKIEGELDKFLLCNNAFYSLGTLIQETNNLGKINRKEYVLIHDEIINASSEIMTYFKKILNDQTISVEVKKLIKEYILDYNNQLLKEENDSKDILLFSNHLNNIFKIEDFHITFNSNVVELLTFIRTCISNIQKLRNLNLELKTQYRIGIQVIEIETLKISNFLKSNLNSIENSKESSSKNNKEADNQ